MNGERRGHGLDVAGQRLVRLAAPAEKVDAGVGAVVGALHGPTDSSDVDADAGGASAGTHQRVLLVAPPPLFQGGARQGRSGGACAAAVAAAAAAAAAAAV